MNVSERLVKVHNTYTVGSYVEMRNINAITADFRNTNRALERELDKQRSIAGDVAALRRQLEDLEELQEWIAENTR